MLEIYRKLYIGSDKDVPKARERGYKIIHSAKEGPYGHRQLLGYTSQGAPKSSEYLVAKRSNELYLNLVDHHDPSFIPDEAINAALSFIKEHLAKGEPVLVACNQGASRGPGIGFLYLVTEGKMPNNYQQASKKFKQLYPYYDPAQGMELYIKKRIRENRNGRS